MSRPENQRFSPESIDLKGLDKAAALAALYNGAKPQGLGFMQYDPKPMSIEEARILLEKTQDFDYIKGRVMKVDLSGDQLNPWLYDRDNGQNVAQTLIDSLRETKDPNNSLIHTHHVSETKQSEQVTRELLHEDPSEYRKDGGIHTFYLGLSNHADLLGPKLMEVRESLKNDKSEKD
jgi:hypothetical protein